MTHEVSKHALHSRGTITGGGGGFEEIGCILVMAGHSAGHGDADQCVVRGPRGAGGEIWKAQIGRC